MVIGVTTVIGILLLITIIIGGLMYCKKKQIFSKKRFEQGFFNLLIVIGNQLSYFLYN